MNSDNLEKMANAMNKVLRGEQVPKAWSWSMLRPLPKTDARLYDMDKVWPIALMEVMLKLLERVLFTRIESCSTPCAERNNTEGYEEDGCKARFGSWQN